MRSRILVAAAAAALSLSLAAHADPVTELVNINALEPGTQYYVDLSYSLTFDPTVLYQNQFSGLTLVSLNTDIAEITNSLPVLAGFNYDPSLQALTIGGILNGVGSTAGGTDDYFVSVTNLQSDPMFNILIADNQDPSYNLELTTGTAVVISQTPEPSSFVLLGTGLLGVAGVLRKRFA